MSSSISATSTGQPDNNGMRVQTDLLNSRIVALFLESLLCGIFIVTYSMGTWALTQGDRLAATLPRRNKVLLGINTLMLVLAVVHLCLTLWTTLHGFVAKGDTRAATYHALSSDVLFVSVQQTQFYLYVTQTLIGDGFMVYRLFVVWDRRRAVIVVPAILFFIGVVSGYCYTVVPFLAFVFYPVSFFTNALSSILIMWRVLSSQDSEAQEHWRLYSRAAFNFVRYRRVFEAIVQSAAIYSAASISLLVTMFISPNVGLYACLSVFPPLIGLVFSLIVLQIGRNSGSATADHDRASSLARWDSEEPHLPLQYSVGGDDEAESESYTYVHHTKRSLSYVYSVDTVLTIDDASKMVQVSEGSGY
ncbi:hypothetical protein V8D89_006683 [Ganoderma adspersum]